MATRKIVKPAYATFMNLFEYLKVLVLLSIVLFSVLLAKMYVKPIRNVAEILIAKNAVMFALTMPVINGFSSTAPEYKTPITVVKASMEPSRMIKKLGNTSDLNLYIEAFSFSLLLLLPQNTVYVQGLRTRLLKSIYSKLKTAKKLFSEP